MLIISFIAVLLNLVYLFLNKFFIGRGIVRSVDINTVGNSLCADLSYVGDGFLMVIMEL